LHLPMMGSGYEDYEPMSRDRFVAGSLMPAAWYVKAQKFRQVFQKQVKEIFGQYDVLIAPATPWQAPQIGTEWLEINGKTFSAKASLSLQIQPTSFIGLPVVVVPLQIPNSLPIGVQIIAAPWREDLAPRVAAYLEKTGIVKSLVKGN
jgi:Asp-tRNA(Asn)/Glu-tRNA(Gln) amidotransferase A subunit family amidase